MFQDTLLDSSIARRPALGRIQRMIALGAGALAFLVAFFSLPIVLAPAGTRALIAQSAVVGAGCMLYALMLCYVHADARRLGLQAWLWSGVTLLFNLAGFLAYLVYSAAKTGDWRRAALPMGYVMEVLLVGTLVLVPLLYIEGLPKTTLTAYFPVPPAPPPLGAARRATETRSVRRLTAKEILTTPVKIPNTIEPIVESPGPPQAVTFEGPGVPGGDLNAIRDGVLSDIFAAGASPPPPPIPATKPRQPTKIHVGGQVEAAKLIFGPKPAYPPLAIIARVQGAVRLEAVIGRDGSVEQLKVLAGQSGNGRGLALALSADALEWRTGRG